jgi:nitrate/TMAO reductase-like tetraheme cytochrome c subunit
MGELSLSRKELAELIKDGISRSCPSCSSPIHLKFEPGEREKEEEKEKEKGEKPTCISCGKPITEYAFAVRKGLCADCWGVAR